MLCWSSATWTPCGRDRPIHVLLYLLLTRLKSQKPLTNWCGFLGGRINDAFGEINGGKNPQRCHQVHRDRLGRWCIKAIKLMYYKQHNEYGSVNHHLQAICNYTDAHHLGLWRSVTVINHFYNRIQKNLFRIQNTSQVSHPSMGLLWQAVLTVLCLLFSCYNLIPLWLVFFCLFNYSLHTSKCNLL